MQVRVQPGIGGTVLAVLDVVVLNLGRQRVDLRDRAVI